MNQNLGPQFENTHDVAYRFDKRDNPWGAEPPEGLHEDSTPHFRSRSFHDLIADRQETSPEHLAGVVNDVARRGIQKPIGIDYGTTPPTVSDGHTRLIGAFLAGHKKVPVVNHPLDAGFEVTR